MPRKIKDNSLEQAPEKNKVRGKNIPVKVEATG